MHYWKYIYNNRSLLEFIFDEESKAVIFFNRNLDIFFKRKRVTI